MTNLKPPTFPFHKHLMLMECRKDIIFQNDFINQKFKDKSTSFYTKYSDKIQKNKMRIAYLVGFSVLFSLNYIYDLVFQSKIYHNTTSSIFDKNYTPTLNQVNQIKVNYKKQEALKLGQYFLQLQKRNITREITPSKLSGMIPIFSQYSKQWLDINNFVDFCLKNSITMNDLPAGLRI